MDIGTNKPSATERALVTHHLIDVVNPDEDFNLAIYRRLAIQAMNQIEQKGKVPFLVGGSGLYVWSLVEGWKIPEVPPDWELRKRLEARAKKEGSYSLYQELQAIDPAASARIDPANTRRVIRALEIYHATGVPPSRLWSKETPEFPVLIIGLTQERTRLYRRIDCRIDGMIKRGFVEEVRQLLERGYSPSLPSMSGIGYRQIVQFLRGEVSLSEAVDQIKWQTHRLARHQYAWFRLNDGRIHWFDVDDENLEAKTRKLIEDFLS